MTSWVARAADRAPGLEGRRERAVEISGAIVAAAQRLLVTQPGGFTVQELAREAGVGLPTFYRHFRSKDELMLVVFGDLIARAAEHYEEQGRTYEDPLDRLSFYLRVTLATLGDEHVARFATAEFLRLRQVFPAEMADVTRPVADLVLAVIREAAAAGQIAPVDPPRDAELITDVIVNAYHRHAVAPEGPSADEVATHLVGFVLHGLGASPQAQPRQSPRASREGSAS